MKDYIIGLALAAVLMFSFNGTEFTPTGRSGTPFPGESDLVLPGNGEEPAEVVFAKAESPDTEAENRAETITEAIPEAISECEKEQNMNDMTMFWCGVAAVLIVETGLLAAAAVWLRIKMAGMDSGM